MQLATKGALNGCFYGCGVNESRKGLLYHQNGEGGLLSMRIRMHEQRRCKMILLEVQGTRVFGHKGPKVKRRTCALTGSEVITFETSPWRLNVGSICVYMGFVCLSSLVKYDNGNVDWLKRGSNR